uniref:Uncharacterized protein n=1 Tax=Oryza brachyantha TaxID=4533 RepID=J3MYC8_ORYBR
MAAMDDHQSKVQRLYDACDAVFSSGSKAGLPTLTQIRWLQDLLDGMEAADVGIDAGGGGGGGERSSRRRAGPAGAAVSLGGGVHPDHLRAHIRVRRFLDRRVLLPGRRDAAAARPPADGGAEQASLRLDAGQVVRLGERGPVLGPKEEWSSQSGRRRRGAGGAVQGVGPLPAERRQRPLPHRRHAVRAPRRAGAALRRGPRPAVHLLLRHPHPFPPRFCSIGRGRLARRISCRRGPICRSRTHARHGQHV